MHFCTAHIALGGDDRNIMYRDRFSPVSWPEIEILRIVHGDHSVTSVEPFVAVGQHPREERTRLSEIYGDGIAAQAWGGRNAPSDMEAPGVRPVEGIVWWNPLTHEIELTGKDGKSDRAPDRPEPASLAESVGDMTRPPPEPEPVEDDELEAVGEASSPARERTATGTFLPRKK